MADLATLQEAKDHLRLPDLGSPDPRADDLQLKLDTAEEMVLDHIARPSDEDWTAAVAAWDSDSVPKRVKLAILVQFAHLHRFRGDDAPQDESKAGDRCLPPEVRRLLIPYHDPTVA